LTQNPEEIEIDLSWYIKVLLKYKKTFIAVFLLIIAIGFVYKLNLFNPAPKIYRITTLLQPPVRGEALTGANDLESAENLKGLIVNKAFDEALRKRLKLAPDKNDFVFNVAIPDKTNILQVSIDMESNKKEFGLEILQNLIDLITETYVNRIDAIVADIASQIKFNELSIVNAQEKAKNLEEQIKEIIGREDKLKEELRFINTNTVQILDNRKGLLKAKAVTENAALSLASYFQNNSSYLNQVNNQFIELSLRKINLGLELKYIDPQVKNMQMAIDKLNISKGFISNLKILSLPRVSSVPLSQKKKKISPLSLVIGLFSGAVTVFLQEFWATKLKKHA